MSPLVKLTVGEVGRAGARSRRPSAASGGSGSEATSPEVAEWSCRWSPEGPVEIARGCPAEPDLALALSPQDAQAVREGRLAPSVAFMQGRLKTTGDNALLLQVLQWTASPAFERARRALG